MISSEAVSTFTPTRTRTLREQIGEVWQYRAYIAYQVRRSLRTEYLRSLLGWSWAIITPLATLLIYSVVFGTILGGNRSLPFSPAGLDSFPHYLFSALVFWQLFSELTNRTMSEFLTTVNVRKRLYVPAAAPAVARMFSLQVEKSLELVVLVGAYAVVGGVRFTFVQLLLIWPLMALFGLGVGMFMAIGNARYRDVGLAYSIILRLMFFCTPIIYLLDNVPETWAGIPLRRIISLNPITQFVDASRTATYELAWIPADEWIVLFAISLGALAIGWTVFAKKADDIAEGL